MTLTAGVAAWTVITAVSLTLGSTGHSLWCTGVQVIGYVGIIAVMSWSNERSLR